VPTASAWSPPKVERGVDGQQVDLSEAAGPPSRGVNAAEPPPRLAIAFATSGKNSTAECMASGSDWPLKEDLDEAGARAPWLALRAARAAAKRPWNASAACGEPPPAPKAGTKLGLFARNAGSLCTCRKSIAEWPALLVLPAFTEHPSATLRGTASAGSLGPVSGVSTTLLAAVLGVSMRGATLLAEAPVIGDAALGGLPCRLDRRDCVASLRPPDEAAATDVVASAVAAHGVCGSSSAARGNLGPAAAANARHAA